MQLLDRRHGRRGRKAGEKNSNGRDMGRPGCRGEKEPIHEGKKTIVEYEMLPSLQLRVIHKIKHTNLSKLKALKSIFPSSLRRRSSGMFCIGHVQKSTFSPHEEQASVPHLLLPLGRPAPARAETPCLFAVEHDVIKSSVTKQRAAGGGSAAARQPRD